MAGKGGKKGSQGAVIIKKNEIVEGGHHGGAWKVAYADFVTAMMAFFLLMWLLNATTQDQRKGLADYFSPSNILSHNSSGSGQPFGGHTPFDDGEMVSDRGKVDVTMGRRPVVDQTADGDDPVQTDYHRARSGDGKGVGPSAEDQDVDDDTPMRGQPTGLPAAGAGGPADRTAGGSAAKGGIGAGTAAGGGTGLGAADKAALEAAQQAAAAKAADNARQEKAAFETAAGQIRQAVKADPALAEIANQLSIDQTPRGMRLQIMDEIKLPMFSNGSASPNDRARMLVQKLLPMLNKLNEPISIAGYTDAAPFPGPDRTNWELSTERANAMRRMLVEGGFPEGRIQSVTGHADHDLLLPADPFAAANRRIAIMVLRQAPSPPVQQAPAPAEK